MSDIQTDVTLPDRPKKFAPLAGAREHERLSVGSFFAEHRALADAKRDHLGRLGMDPRHVNALRMPDAVERPMPVMGEPAVAPVLIDAPHAPPEAEESAEPRTLPTDLEARSA